MSTYLETVKNVYKEAAENPQKGLCCTTTPVWQLPGLKIPDKMLEMNYGCGSTVNPRDLVNDPSILYVGVGGGMELLQFAYFSRKAGGVTGIDPVEEMLNVCSQNFNEVEKLNPWFKKEFVELRSGDALELPIENETVDIAAQNCLFNIFHDSELEKALKEMYRVLKPRGRLVLSDPVCETPIPENLMNDERLRALCLSGAIPLQDYVNRLTSIGFGTLEIRAKRPYRVLDPVHYDTKELLVIESVRDLCNKRSDARRRPLCFYRKDGNLFRRGRII